MSGWVGVRWRPDRVMFRRYAFAWAYLACYLAAELVWVLLTPHAQATLAAWASTNVASLEHEPIGPLVLSAFVGMGYLLVWPGGAAPCPKPSPVSAADPLPGHGP